MKMPNIPFVEQLDEEDYEDTFGIEGWRHHFGVENER